jgi:ABC-2 type transport system permease protein
MVLLSPRLRAQIIKELLCILRDPRSRIVLIVPPLIQLLLFSFAATLDVRHVAIALYDRDGGRWSQELTAHIAAARFVSRIHTVTDPAQLRALIEQGTVIAGIDIPEHFSQTLAAGQHATIQVLIDGRRANAGQVTSGYLGRIADDLGVEVNAITTPAASGASGDAAEFSVTRHWFNPNLEYQWYIVPSLAGTLTTFIALILTALSIARERELGTFDQLLVSPTTPIEIIIAKTVPAVLICTALGLMMITIGIVVFRIPFTGSFPLLAAAMTLYILSVVGIGLAISTVCATQQQAILGAFAAGVPMILLSGFATPVENMPVVLQWVAQAIPLQHVLPILQGSFLKALPFMVVVGHAWPIGLIALVTLALAGWCVRMRLQ